MRTIGFGYGRHHNKRRVKIQLALANLHWCSDEALAQLSETSRKYGVPLHMHLLETAHQKEYARRRGGGTAVEYIDRFGPVGTADDPWSRRGLAVKERPEPSTRINNRRTSSGRKRDRAARTWPRPCRRALDKTAAAPDRGDPAARALIALMSEKSLRLSRASNSRSAAGGFAQKKRRCTKNVNSAPKISATLTQGGEVSRGMQRRSKIASAGYSGIM
jgi:hypothetical protein